MLDYFFNMKLSFTDDVYGVVAKIPKGKVLTYKEVAILVGSPKSFRAVGNVLHKNHNPNIPCHRVVRSDGKVGGYNKGSLEKIKRLRREGVII